MDKTLKTPRFLILCLAVLLLMVAPRLSSQEPAAKQCGLTFIAKPTKQSFAQSEKITFNFELRNSDSKDLLVSSAFILGYDVALDIKDSDGKSVPWCGPIAQWIPLGKKLTKLQHGTSLAVEREISCNKHAQEGYELLTRGRYVAVARYWLPANSKSATEGSTATPISEGPYLAAPVEFTDQLWTRRKVTLRLTKFKTESSSYYYRAAQTGLGSSTRQSFGPPPLFRPTKILHSGRDFLRKEAPSVVTSVK